MSRTLLDEEANPLYTVAYSSGDKFASDEFTSFMKATAGAEVIASQAAYAPDKNSNTIVLGSDLAKAAGMDFAGLTTDNGYIIKLYGNNIYVYGKTTQGTLNGVYELLNRAVGLKIYTDNCYTVDHETGTEVTVYCRDKDAVFNPKIDYLYDLNGETRNNQTYQKRLGYILDYAFFGGNAHAETSFVENTAYFTGQLNNGHMPLNEKTAKEAAKWFYETQVETQQGKEEFFFGLGDNAEWYDDTAAGQARTDQYVTFMNQMAAELSGIMTSKQDNRTISLILLAYNNTIKAPSVSLVSQANVRMKVMYAPVQANWYKPLMDTVNDAVPVTNSDASGNLFTYDADAEFQKWADVAGKGNIYLWAYHTFFDNYLTPLDCLEAMRQNYALAEQMGVAGVYDNVQYDNEVASDWNRLKVYVRSELVKNPSMTEAEYDQRIDSFMNAYFGVAADDMKHMLSEERSLLNTVYENVRKKISAFRQNYGCGQAAVMINKDANQYSFWGIKRTGTSFLGYKYTNILLKDNIYSHITAAYNTVQKAVNNGTITVEEGTKLTARIKLESLAVRFILLRVPGNADDSYEALLGDCNELGLTHIKEGKTITLERLKSNDAP